MCSHTVLELKYLIIFKSSFVTGKCNTRDVTVAMHWDRATRCQSTSCKLVQKYTKNRTEKAAVGK